MRLNKYKKINVASFLDFNWNNEVQDFNDINIVLGWNGTGKTIISRILRSFEFGGILGLPDNSQFQLEFDMNSYNQFELEGFGNKVKVFNEDYIKEITSVGELPHIFYLGEDAVDFSEKEKELEKLRSQIKTCINEHTTIAESVARNIKSLAGIATLKKELQSGVYNTFDKRGFEMRVNDFDQKISKEGALLSDFKMKDEELKIAQRQIAQQSDKRREFNLLKEIDDWIETNQNKIKDLVHIKIEFTPSLRIDSYPKDSIEYKWINDGVNVHHLNNREHKKDTCIFCNNSIQNNEELIRHFTNDIIELNKYIDIYLMKIKSFQDRMTQTDFTFYSKEAEILSTFLTETHSKLKYKKTHPDEQNIVEDHKRLIPINIEEDNNFDIIAQIIEKHLIADVYSDYKTKSNGFELCTGEQKDIKSLIEKNSKELQELKSKAKNAHRPAERLNKLIKVTFPFKNIEIRDSEDGIGYSLYRNNNSCGFNTLSEGERNFIALAYFLISLNSVDDENSLSKDGIVLIDDPVSSLDKNSIFQIFSIISYEMENNPERQYFILTHNLEFFSHLHDHYKSKITEGQVQLYQVNLNKNGSKLSNIHSLLRKFKSDYQYSVKILWKNKENCTIEDSFLIVNLLRRVWETFLHFKFSSNGSFKSLLEKAYNEALNQKLKNLPDSLPEERKEEIKSDFRSNFISMYRFTNYGSHEFGNVDTIDESILLTASDRINNFFSIVETLDKHHYKKITTGSD